MFGSVETTVEELWAEIDLFVFLWRDTVCLQRLSLAQFFELGERLIIVDFYPMGILILKRLGGNAGKVMLPGGPFS
jgi:hypothetical protein